MINKEFEEIFKGVDLQIPYWKLETSKKINFEIKKTGLSIKEFCKTNKIERETITQILLGENYEIDSLLEVLKVLNLDFEIKSK